MLQKLFTCDVYAALFSKAIHIKNMPVKSVSKS